MHSMENKLHHQRKKVLFFSQPNVGGAERMTVNIAKMLPEDEYQIVFCIFSWLKLKQAESSIKDFIPNGTPILEIKIRSQFDYLWQLYQVMKEVKPDFVFSSIMHNNQRLLILRPFFRKCKFIVRNDNYLFTLPKIKKFTLSISYRLADMIVAQTEEMRDEFVAIGFNSKKIRVLHNPVETEIIKHKAKEYNPYREFSESVNYVAIGRLVPQKGYDLLVRAFKKVLESNPNSNLWIVGDENIDGGKIKSDIQEYSRVNKFEHKFHLVGYSSNPYPYISNADCFVLSSRYEGLPNVLVESLTLGTPAAAFECIPIINRIIGNGKNGFIAKPENISDLAEAMLLASKLGRVTLTYQPASRKQFIELFNE